MISPNCTITLPDLFADSIPRDWEIPKEFHSLLDVYRIQVYEWKPFWIRSSADFYFPLGSTHYKIICASGKCLKPKKFIIASFRKPLDPRTSKPIVLIKSMDEKFAYPSIKLP